MYMKKYFIGTMIVGLLFICLSIYGIFHKDIEYIETKGIITDINSDYDSISEQTIYKVYIDYSVDNVEYKNVEYGAYNSSMQIGDEVIVYYSPDNPTFIQAEGYKKVPYVVLAISIVFELISIFFFIRS